MFSFLIKMAFFLKVASGLLQLSKTGLANIKEHRDA